MKAEHTHTLWPSHAIPMSIANRNMPACASKPAKISIRALVIRVKRQKQPQCPSAGFILIKSYNGILYSNENKFSTLKKCGLNSQI